MKRTLGSLICMVLLLGLVAGAEAYSIRDDATGGDCSSIGIWNAVTKTCTLTTDLYHTYDGYHNSRDDQWQLLVWPGVTVDGNGHMLYGNKVAGVGTFGVLVYVYDVTIKNLAIKNFWAGVEIQGGDANHMRRLFAVGYAQWLGQTAYTADDYRDYDRYSRVIDFRRNNQRCNGHELNVRARRCVNRRTTGK